MAAREFSRAEYRRQVGWERRLHREGPFLRAFLESAPAEGAVLDLGCGTGEHARFLATLGCRVLGLDFSRDAVVEAARTTQSGCVTWCRGDLRKLPIRDGAARAIICLGNTLVIPGDDDGILTGLREMQRVLVPGGRVLVQILNYHRLRSGGVRNLPLNFRSVEGMPEESGKQEDSELVYLRLMDFDAPDQVDFHVITLQRQAGLDEVVVKDAVRRRLRSLEHHELVRLLGEAGFEKVALFGDYDRTGFRPETSADVIALARRPE